jgi:hypothetical protein
MPIEIVGLALFAGTTVFLTAIVFAYIEKRIQAIESVLADDLEHTD